MMTGKNFFFDIIHTEGGTARTAFLLHIVSQDLLCGGDGLRVSMSLKQRLHLFLFLSSIIISVVMLHN